MRPENLISLSLLALRDRRESGRVGHREDVIRELETLRSQGFPVRGISVQPTPDGALYSEDVWEFIGRLAIAGHVVQESPIRLTQRGADLLEASLLQEASTPETADELRRAARILNFEASFLHEPNNPDATPTAAAPSKR